MKHNFIRKVLSAALACSVMVLGSVNVSSTESGENTVSDLLGVYEHKFELLNEKYGTDLHIAAPVMTEAELNDLLTRYASMTDEEFEEYFLDNKEKSEYYLQAQSENHVVYYDYGKNICSLDDILREGGKVTFSKNFQYKDTGYGAEESIMDNVAVPYSPTIEETQFYFYDVNNNSLWLMANVNYTQGWGQYISLVAGGSAVVKYPAYVVDNSTPIGCEIKSYYQKCDAVCDFPCYYSTSEGVLVGSLQHKYVTFTAGWGNIYYA